MLMLSGSLLNLLLVDFLRLRGVQEGRRRLLAGDLFQLVRVVGAAVAADGLVDVSDQSLVQNHALTELQVRDRIAAQVGDEVGNDDQGLSLQLFGCF